MPFLDFTAGDVLTAANMDITFRQGVMTFADASARDTALTGVLAEGMVAYLEDTDRTTMYDGSAWKTVGTHIQAGVYSGTTGTNGSVVVVFDEPFATAPGCAAMVVNSDSGEQDTMQLTSSSSTQLSMRAMRNNTHRGTGGAITVYWVAIGVTQ